MTVARVEKEPSPDDGGRAGRAEGLATVNEVRLIGRLSLAAEERELPSGDQLTAFRVVVNRPRDKRRGSRVQIDALECHTWIARVRRAAMTWQVGDVIEVNGSLRRRFFKTGGRLQSMTEVEVLSARRVSRAGAATKQAS
ncbi:single-stranded DNA-binding protein [Nocardioides panzhihuensis]|uniref:Single-strand DNA-binding protein n=1 Tax=Nocardioides panzhihuensis TaxID=860243 RepID=A0A7Z0DKT5_9ACTN|nr:single-stranded DNA-binding protein [Nocardioides panzhihuensis]NYI77203.1 single-strand DNA-binding protein [Nocardioides panzhihuensis]